MTAWRLSLVPVLMVAAACEWKVTSRVGVQVVEPLQRVRGDGTRENPVAGAGVRIQCPDGAIERLGATDAAGWVLVTTRAPVGLDCDLAIDVDRHSAALVPVAEACAQKESGECRVLEVRWTTPGGLRAVAGGEH